MITKLVTQDIYGNTHIYRNQVHTTSETVKGKCKICGKTITKTISVQYINGLTGNDYEYLENSKKEWLSQEHICNKCYKKALTKQGNPISKDRMQANIDRINYLGEQISDLRKQISMHTEDISEEVKGKVCIYQDKEYVIQYVSNFDEDWYIRGYKIDVNKPWYETSTEFYISREGKGYGGSKTVNAKFEDVVFTDEVFAERKEKVKKWEKENEHF